MDRIFDVIVVGAGPGGSSTATFLGRRGISVLLLDKAHFPRDKVCGDGLAPQALYWLEVLGCVDEVLEQTKSYCCQGDIFLNGQRVLTGTFPQNTAYPGFSVLLERKRLDFILVRNAVSHGALFRPGCRVKGLHWLTDWIVVEAVEDGRPVQFKARLVIGADGANSVVTRCIGNRVMNGTTAVSVRGYYKGVRLDGPPIRIYFDERFFPGYGWVFVDDEGMANIGIGYAFDEKFPVRMNLKSVFDRFIHEDLRENLKHAEAAGKPKGGWASFYKPGTMVADRVMLIGDAANLADPINGGGIHNAMESAHLASEVALQAIARGDFSMGFLSRYATLWSERREMDWRTGELMLSIAKNPNLREICLLLIQTIAGVIRENPRFEEFCGGIFSGTLPARKCLCPRTLLSVTPLDPRSWLLALVAPHGSAPSPFLGHCVSAARVLLKTGGRVLEAPLTNLEWGTEILTKAIGLVDCYARRQLGFSEHSFAGYGQPNGAFAF